MAQFSIKKKLVLLMACIIAVVSVLSIMVFSSLRKVQNDVNIVNALGRQRMLSQAMARSILDYAMSKNSLKNTELQVSDLNKYITKMRGTYTSLVVVPAKKSGLALSMSPGGEGHAAIPFPATFTRLVNEAFGKDSNLDVKIISKAPINPKQGLNDAVDEDAYGFLLNNNGKIYFKSVEESGKLFLRFYTADLASVEACAECHSKIQGRSFKVGDMLGIRKFSILFSSDIAIGKSRLDPDITEFETARKVFTETLAAFKSGGQFPADLNLSAYIKTSSLDGSNFQSKILEIEKELANFKQHVDDLNTSTVGSDENWKAQDNVKTGSLKLRKLSDDLAQMYGDKSEEKNRFIALAFGVLAIIVVATFIGVYLFINRAILNPLSEVVNVANMISKGDLTKSINTVRHDEVGALSEALNTMSKSLNKMVSKITTTSTQLAATSNQISSASKQVVEGAESQTEQSGMVASASEEMSATVLEVAKNSTEASELAKKASEVARGGGEIVRKTIQGMSEISQSVKDSATTIENLGRSSDQIGEIVEVIDDIADQTNLLALNAAIEAARAGEQGRGFAVVADEVRKLAERTTKATKEIASMIKKVQSETEGAVKSMRAGTDEVKKGVDLTNQAGSSLSQIEEVVGRVNDMIRMIATAAEEQSSASLEISMSIEKVATVAKETSSRAQESSLATEELTKLSVELNDLVGQFKLN